jgi:hypothetical protein
MKIDMTTIDITYTSTIVDITYASAIVAIIIIIVYHWWKHKKEK